MTPASAGFQNMFVTGAKHHITTGYNYYEYYWFIRYNLLTPFFIKLNSDNISIVRCSVRNPYGRIQAFILKYN